MTCIISYKQDGKVILAGDKAGSNGFSGHLSKEPKVFTNGDFMIGYTTSFRMGQILNHLWTAPKRKVDQNTVKYLYVDVIPSIMECFDDHNFGDSKENKYGNFVMVYENEIYEVQGDMSMLQHDTDIVCVGSGEYHATAAVRVLLDYEHDDKKILNKAFKVVSDNIVSVSKEFDFITSE